jgi:hypothetical protein
MRFREALLASVVLLFGAVGAAGQGVGSKVSMIYSLKPNPHVTVTNNYSSPLTGLVIIVPDPAAPGRPAEAIWYDSGVNFAHNPPLETGQSYSFPVGPIDKAPTFHPRVTAVTFQDFTSAGSRHWLAELHARREAAYNEIAVVTDLLKNALDQHQQNAGIVAALQAMRASLPTKVPHIWPRIAAEYVIYFATSNLERGGVVGHIGDPRDTIPVILPIFTRWRTALKRTDRTVG